MGERIFDITVSHERFGLKNRKTGESCEVKPLDTGLGLCLECTYGRKKYNHEYHWYSIVPIIQYMVGHLYEADESRPLPKGKEKCPAEKRLEWNKNRATKCVAKALTDEWRKLLSIDRYQKYIVFDRKHSRIDGCSNTMGYKDYWHNINHPVWTDPYLYNDAITYQPCMMLLAKGDFTPYLENPWATSGYEKHYKDWKQCYAFEGKPYHALNKTLLSVNYSIPFYLLSTLDRVKLARPLETRAELISYLSLNMLHDVRDDIRTIVLKAGIKDIRRTAKYLRDQHLQTNLRKYSGYFNMIGYLRDYEGEPYHGSLLGLAKRSVEWHERQRQEQAKSTLKVAINTPTAAPPFDYAKVRGAKHLACVQDVVDEGKFMGHCVASYAQWAVKGNCYLFHIEHPTTKEVATVEIGKGQGEYPFMVRQSQGPQNKKNSASEYAKRKFNELFKKLGVKK